MASVLRRTGISGWRRHVPLPGTPDFVWREQRVAVFVDGCFWHGCPRCYRSPRHNPSFWRAKIEGNRNRDKKVARRLRAKGWRVLRIWECQIAEDKSVMKIVRSLRLGPKR
jgi:DNA mismatch endonuclease (patch repair protein)